MSQLALAMRGYFHLSYTGINVLRCLVLFIFFYPKAWTPISALTISVGGKISLTLQCQWVESEGLREDLPQFLALSSTKSQTKATPPLPQGHSLWVPPSPSCGRREKIHKMATPIFAWPCWSPIQWDCGPICWPGIWALLSSTPPPEDGEPGGQEGTGSLILPRARVSPFLPPPAPGPNSVLGKEEFKELSFRIWYLKDSVQSRRQTLAQSWNQSPSSYPWWLGVILHVPPSPCYVLPLYPSLTNIRALPGSDLPCGCGTLCFWAQGLGH